MLLADRAPAKINLMLHVVGRRPDGYHALESLVAFAGVSDHLVLRPGAPLGIEVGGPFAIHAGNAEDNLVLRAARGLAARIPGLRLGRFSLTKRIPSPAGLGGGSADAAAALRLLARLNGLPLSDPRLAAAAAETGSDVPVCLVPRARMFFGRGDEVGPPLGLAPVCAVLVNPRADLPTRAVFAALGLKPGETLRSAGSADRLQSCPPTELLGRLAETCNDLEPPAAAIEPTVQEALAAVASQPEARLTRMTGSGATVFALVADRRAAVALARRVQAGHPGWWVTPTLLR